MAIRSVRNIDNSLESNLILNLEKPNMMIEVPSEVTSIKEKTFLEKISNAQ